MHSALSCTAPFVVPNWHFLTYIHFNDEAFFKI